jgi:HEAT repeat protein
LFSDPEADVRAAAAMGLGSMFRSIPNVAIPQWGGQLLDKSNAVRRAAAEAIWGSPDVALPPELAAALMDESAEVRNAAARALVNFRTSLDPIIPRLVFLMEQDKPEVRDACAAVLGEAWPTSALVPTLTATLKSRQRAVRYQAARLLGRIGPEASAAVPALVVILDEPLDQPAQKTSRFVQAVVDPACEAARALGQMEPSDEAIGALTKLLASANADRVAAAADALGSLGPQAVAAVPALIAAYGKVSESVQWVGNRDISNALGRLAPRSPYAQKAVAILIGSLDSKTPWVRSAAAQALGAFGKEAAGAVPKLRRLREGSDKLSTDAAAAALAAIEGLPKPKQAASPARATGRGPRPVSAN